MPRLTWTVRVTAFRSVFVDPDECVMAQADDANAFAARGVFPLAVILNTFMRPRLERELGLIARIQAIYRHPPTGLVFVDVSARPRNGLGDAPRGFFAVDEDSLSAALFWQGFDDDTFRDWITPTARVSRSKSTETSRPSRAGGSEVVSPAARAVGAAYDLQREGRPVSLRAACEKAGVDRANLRARSPEAVRAIEALARPDRAPRRGVRDRRSENVDGWDSDADD